MEGEIVETRNRCKDQRQQEKEDEEGDRQNDTRRERGVYRNADCKGCQCSIIEFGNYSKSRYGSLTRQMHQRMHRKRSDNEHQVL